MTEISTSSQAFMSLTLFLIEHGTTIMVSSVVFALMSLVTAVMTQSEAADPLLKKKTRSLPQPKWAVLQILNYLVMAVFVSSITYAAVSYRQRNNQPVSASSPITSSFFPMMCLWSMCLAYFFGFFGISFLDTSKSPTDPSLEASVVIAEANENSTVESSSRPVVSISKNTPRHDTAICSDVKGNSAAISSLSAATASVTPADFDILSDDEVFTLVLNGSLKDYELEKKLGDCERAVRVRRMLYENILDRKLDLLPYTGFDYGKVLGANCEIVIGYVPLPCGVVGPLNLNGESIYIPMATTEGCLVASTNRGCKALTSAGGCQSVLLKDGITRAPCLRMPSAMRAAAMKSWLNFPENYAKIEEAFNSTTNYGRLESVDATVAGRNIYLRFCCMSGDAMGMNMVSKGCLKAIEALEVEFPDLELVAISGNMCTDKKPAAINWILGRGKSVVVEAIVPEAIVKSVLKSSVHDMIETNKQKNHIGSAMAGSIGGFNAHAANIVTAVFLATGQDPAQNVESSNCLTIMEYADDGKSLYVSVTMPSIEVGTVGGGTHLPAQAACLDICGVRGSSRDPSAQPGDNSRKLAQIVGAAVLAGELSLMAALAANHLVRSHMQHNRKPSEPAPSAVKVAASILRKNASMPEMSKVGEDGAAKVSSDTTNN